MRTCTKCKTEKEESCFSLDKYNDRLHSWCKSCNNEKNKKWLKENKEKIQEYRKGRYSETKDKIRWQVVKRKYGISENEYLEMLKKQGGGCAICGKIDAKHWQTNNLLIDHCHTTGKVRGLLCNNCNTALGLVSDNIDTLKQMIKYLK